MRKLFSRVFCGLICMMAVMATCHAEKVMPTMDGTLDRSQIALGNVRPGDSPEQVIAVWGDPMAAESTEHGKMIYAYGNHSFVVVFSHNRVKSIRCTQDGDATTPDGVTVWQDEVVLDWVYGMASQIEEQEDGRTVYAYWGNITAPWQYLTFTTKNGSIVQAACGTAE